jgi:hypothetical protein
VILGGATARSPERSALTRAVIAAERIAIASGRRMRVEVCPCGRDADSPHMVMFPTDAPAPSRVAVEVCS